MLPKIGNQQQIGPVLNQKLINPEVMRLQTQVLNQRQLDENLETQFNPLFLTMVRFAQNLGFYNSCFYQPKFSLLSLGLYAGPLFFLGQKFQINMEDSRIKMAIGTLFMALACILGQDSTMMLMLRVPQSMFIQPNFDFEPICLFTLAMFSNFLDFETT